MPCSLGRSARMLVVLALASAPPWLAASDSPARPLAEPALTATDWSHWAFQKPMRPTLPVVEHPEWVRSPIDAFVRARLQQAGLQSAPPADRATLLRRVTFDLTGLPP